MEKENILSVCEETTASNSGDAEVLDRVSLLTRVGGDEELLAGLIEIFMSECPKQLVQIREAIASGEPQSLEAAAHSYKGILQTLSANAAAAVASRLELLGREGDVTSAMGARKRDQSGVASISRCHGRRCGVRSDNHESRVTEGAS
jgi:HPt (histidine-containing phosphotransfer) domain-containing protein